MACGNTVYKSNCVIVLSLDLHQRSILLSLNVDQKIRVRL